MNRESRESVETLLLAFSRLLDETAPQELMPKILEAAMQVLSADAAILDIPGETPLHISLPKNIAISESAVVQAKTENRVRCCRPRFWLRRLRCCAAAVV